MDDKWKDFMTNKASILINNIYEYSKLVERNKSTLQKTFKTLKFSGKDCFFAPLSDVGAHITIAKPPPKAKGKKIFFKLSSIKSKIHFFKLKKIKQKIKKY